MSTTDRHSTNTPANYIVYLALCF